MTFETFGYRGLFSFKSPVVAQNQDETLLIIATPYGNTNSLESSLEEFITEFETQAVDLDSTSPYPKLTCLNPHENLVFTNLQFLNDIIYSNHNKEVVNLACDFFCFYKVRSTLYFAQQGWPLILLHRDGQNIPLSAEYASLPVDKSAAPFIPAGLLGLESSVNLKINQINLDEKSEILLMKSNESPDSLMSLYPCPLKEIANVYASENPEQGFWMAKIADFL